MGKLKGRTWAAKRGLLRAESRPPGKFSGSKAGGAATPENAVEGIGFTRHKSISNRLDKGSNFRPCIPLAISGHAEPPEEYMQCDLPFDRIASSLRDLDWNHKVFQGQVERLKQEVQNGQHWIEWSRLLCNCPTYPNPKYTPVIQLVYQRSYLTPRTSSWPYCSLRTWIVPAWKRTGCFDLGSIWIYFLLHNAHNPGELQSTPCQPVLPPILPTGLGVHRVLRRQSTGNLGDEKRRSEISQIGLLVFQWEGQQPFRYLDRCGFCVAGFISTLFLLWLFWPTYLFFRCCYCQLNQPTHLFLFSDLNKVVHRNASTGSHGRVCGVAGDEMQ